MAMAYSKLSQAVPHKRPHFFVISSSGDLDKFFFIIRCQASRQAFSYCLSWLPYCLPMVIIPFPSQRSFCYINPANAGHRSQSEDHTAIARLLMAFHRTEFHILAVPMAWEDAPRDRPFCHRLLDTKDFKYHFPYHCPKFR